MPKTMRYDLVKLAHLAQMALSARAIQQPAPRIVCACYFTNGTNKAADLEIEGGFWREDGSLVLSGTLTQSRHGVVLEFSEYGILTCWRAKVPKLRQLLLYPSDLLITPQPVPTLAGASDQAGLTMSQAAFKTELQILVSSRGLTAGKVAARTNGKLERSSAYAILSGPHFPAKEENLKLFLRACEVSGAELDEWLQRWKMAGPKERDYW